MTLDMEKSEVDQTDIQMQNFFNIFIFSVEHIYLFNQRTFCQVQFEEFILVLRLFFLVQIFLHIGILFRFRKNLSCFQKGSFHSLILSFLNINQYSKYPGLLCSWFLKLKLKSPAVPLYCIISKVFLYVTLTVSVANLIYKSQFSFIILLIDVF